MNDPKGQGKSDSQTRFETGTTPLWWNRNRTSRIYLLRELTGVGIALYMTVFVIAWWVDPSGNFVLAPWFVVLSWIGLVSACFHSFTWLGVTMKILPYDVPRWVEWVGFLVLIGLWAAISLAILYVDLYHFEMYNLTFDGSF